MGHCTLLNLVFKFIKQPHLEQVFTGFTRYSQLWHIFIRDWATSSDTFIILIVDIPADVTSDNLFFSFSSADIFSPKNIYKQAVMHKLKYA